MRTQHAVTLHCNARNLIARKSTRIYPKPHPNLKLFLPVLFTLRNAKTCIAFRCHSLSKCKTAKIKFPQVKQSAN